MLTLFLLFLAGCLGGVINSLAGGGSFIIFPALLTAGLPPVAANATNTFACMPGYLAGAWAFRDDLAKHRDALPRTVLISVIGGALGAAILLAIPPSLFETSIPWLLLVATGLFVTGKRLSAALMAKEFNASGVQIGFAALLLLVSIYGGFFNAGLGIVTLAYLAVAGYDDINTMNGMKLLISTAISVSAIILFAIKGEIAWIAGTAALLGTITGGYLAAHISRGVPQVWVRGIVLVIAIATTIYFFWEVYS
ncbi:sulfite exporter TauE/SafE family protein [Paracoccaceae bacterium GXU_MW_L88]